MATNNFNDMSGYQSAYGTERMIDLLPTMFGRVYTIPPQQAYFDMAENAVSFDTALKNYDDLMKDEMDQFFPEEDVFMTAEDVEAADKDAMEKAIYQVSLEEQGGSDSLMTPYGPSLELNAMDLMNEKYLGLMGGLDPDNYEEEIARADELIAVSGDEIDELVDSVVSRAEREGAIEDTGVLLGLAGDQLHNAITSSGLVDTTMRTIEDIGETVSAVAMNMATMFNEGLEQAGSFWVDNILSSDQAVESQMPPEEDMLGPAPEPYRYLDIENFQPTQAGIESGLGSLFGDIGLGLTSLIGRKSDESISDWYDRTMVTDEGTPTGMGDDIYYDPERGKVDPFLKEIESEKEQQQATIADLNELLNPPYSSIPDIIDEIKSGIFNDIFEKDSVMPWVRQDGWDSMVRNANIDPSLLEDEIQRTFFGKDFLSPGSFAWGGGELSKMQMIKEEERQNKILKGKPHAEEDIQLLRDQGYSWDGAVYILDNGLAGLQEQIFGRGATIKRRLLEGDTPFEAEEYWDNLPDHVKKYSETEEMYALLSDEGLIGEKTKTTEDFKKALEVLLQREEDKRKRQEEGRPEIAQEIIEGKGGFFDLPHVGPVTEEKLAGKFKTVDGKEIYGIRDIETPATTPATVKPTIESVAEGGLKASDPFVVNLKDVAAEAGEVKEWSEYLKDAQKTMKSNFYNAVYAQPGTGTPSVQAMLPNVYTNTLLLFLLQHGNDWHQAKESGATATEEGKVQTAQSLTSLHQGFLNNYFKNSGYYHSDKFLDPYINLIGRVLRKLETHPRKVLESENGGWTQEELENVGWIEAIFHGDTNSGNRKNLIKLKISKGQMGLVANTLTKSSVSMMDQWEQLGYSESWIFDQMMNLYDRKKQTTDPTVSTPVVPPKESEIENKRLVDEALAFNELYPGVSQEGAMPLSESDFIPTPTQEGVNPWAIEDPLSFEARIR